MTVPTTSFAVAAFIVLALPGLVHGSLRRWLLGELHEDRNFGVAVARGIVLSIALASVYAVIFGSGLDLVVESTPNKISVRDWRLLGLSVLVLFIGVPLAGSLAWYQLYHDAINWTQVKWKPLRWVRLPHTKHGYSSTPAAWDVAARNNPNTFVRVKKSNGDWIGGWYTQGSYVTTYPESPSIYIGHQYAMNPDGGFKEQIEGTGVWISISDGDVVSWQTPPDSSAKEVEEDEQRQQSESRTEAAGTD